MKIVLIGASNDSEKYGNKIMKNLISKGHTVIPVNPKEKQIEGIRCHTNLGVISWDYDIINFVVPPNVTLQILKKYETLLKNKKIWIQPGAESIDVIDFLEKNGFNNYITGSCIMVEKIN